MPVASIQEFPPTDDRSTTNYDAINTRLGVAESPPAGLLLHSAGFGEDGTFRMYDVWETREDAERFQQERVMPLVRELLGDRPAGPPPSRQETYDLHNVVVGS